MPQINYEVLSKTAKAAARDIQRTRWVMNLQRTLNTITKHLETLTKRKAEAEHSLAVARFNVTHAEEIQNPTVDELKKDLELVEKDVNAELDRIANEVEAYEKEASEVEEKIKKVSNGELKVDKDRMDSLAKELVHNRISTQFNNGDYDNNVEA